VRSSPGRNRSGQPSAGLWCSSGTITQREWGIPFAVSGAARAVDTAPGEMDVVSATRR
jgi:hypothetical protein